MKRLLALLLCISLLLSGCGIPKSSGTPEGSESEAFITENSDDSHASLSNTDEDATLSYPADTENTLQADNTESSSNSDSDYGYNTNSSDLEFTGLDDTDLLTYVENTVYSDLVEGLDSSDYYVEKTNAIYISNEYLEESAYNSQTNIYFGCSLEEIENEFEGTRYVFTLSDDGTTVVQEFEDYDDTYDKIIQNVAIGSGVILVCITVSLVSSGVNAPAVSMVFAASAKTGATFALSSSVFSGVAKGIITGIETQDFEEAVKAAELGASEGFMWGAISGSIFGGVSEAIALHGAALNGLTVTEAAMIQKESKWPLEAITSIHSMEEYEIYKNANLTPTMLSDGEWIFLRSDIDWNLVDSNGLTNIERVESYLAPIDSTGKSYELHHIGQKADSPLAVLTYTEHHSTENFSILHFSETGKNVGDAEWKKQKIAVWEEILELALAAA